MYNTWWTTARKVKTNSLWKERRTQRECVLSIQSNLISFKSKLHSRNALGWVINRYPTRQKPMLTARDWKSLNGRQTAYGNKKCHGHRVIPETIWKDLDYDNIQYYFFFHHFYITIGLSLLLFRVKSPGLAERVARMYVMFPSRVPYYLTVIDSQRLLTVAHSSLLAWVFLMSNVVVEWGRGVNTFLRLYLEYLA